MKFLFATILLIVHVFSFAQAVQFLPQKILLCNDSSKIKIDIIVIKSEGNNNTIFYFIPKEDSVSNNLFENNEIPFNKKQPLFNKVKILFSFDKDVIAKNKIETLTSYLQKYLLDTFKKDKPNLYLKNNLFYGINDGAIIALNLALQNPERINKTAIYFNNFEPTQLIANEIINNASKLKGKLFVFTNNDESTLNVVDDVITALALKSSSMFYRIDAFNEVIKNIEPLGYNWLLADGNNIILRVDY